MKNKFLIKFISVIIAVSTVLILYLPVTVSAKEYTTDEIYKIATDLINWKKSDNGAVQSGNLINNKYLELAGTTPGDWYQIGMSRLEIEDDYASYLAVIEDKIESRYATKNKLSKAKATEWHRISLSVLASGGDPQNIGTDQNGNAINLIADGTYNRGLTAPLGRQGINGWIWGLIALDSMKYKIPEDAYNTREDIINEIFSKKLSDGGFALSGKTYDTDITAMVIQCLAPYYGTRNDVTETIDKAITLLSANQLETGDFSSWEMPNSESTSQVIIALCSLGIDPFSDSRFIKNGNNLLDGLLRYRMTDGGFIHSYTYDANNPTAQPDKSNTMAGEQALLALASLWRLKNGKTSLYDFTDKEKTVITGFTAEDKQIVDSLPEELSTDDYVTVISLLKKLEDSEDFEDKKIYLQKLKDAKAKIDDIQNKIDNINNNISTHVSPQKEETTSYALDPDLYFEEETSSIPEDSIMDLDSIIKEYESLPETDKSKIEAYEDVVKAKTKKTTAKRAVIISIICILAIGLSVAIIILRIRKRKRLKETEMEELAELYRCEE